MEVLILSSSREDIDSYYKSIAKSISDYLAINNCNLIFGASSSSMMGICYKEFVKYNRKIYAFTTSKYVDDLKNLSSAKTYICNTTFEMKQRMFENSDMIVCLPGGPGTISELLSYIEENRSNDKNIPIIIYDENNYYQKIYEILEEFIKNKFSDECIKEYFVVAKNKQEFENAFYDIIYKNERKR